MAFQFKQFKIEDDQSAMKVGTDAVLLGAWVSVQNATQILDIGTGSGLIALMLAQKSKAKIDAIEIDQASAEQAKQNFEESDWSEQLSIENISLQNYCKSATQKYDLIVSNPPFFDQSLKSTRQEKNISKHNDSLKFNELAYGLKKLLSPDGKAAIILPVVEAKHFLDEARMEGLYLNKKLQIIPVIGTEPNRWIVEISAIRSELSEEILSIRDEQRAYTSEYKNLTKDFYFNF